MILFFTPNHFVDYRHIGLDYLHYNCADILPDIDIHGSAVIMIAVHLYRGLHCLQKRLLVNAGEDETGVVEAFRTLGGGADADSGERMAYGGEEGGFLRKGAGVGDDGAGIHLKTVVIVET